MDTKDVVKLAAAYTAGDLAYDGLLEALGGDNALTDKVVALVGSIGVAGFAAAIAGKSFDEIRELPIAKQVIDATDSIIETATDVVDDALDMINPFSW